MFHKIVLQSSDSASDDGSNESTCSLQEEPTVSAKDSTDITTEYSNDTELEVASSSDTQPHPWSFRPYVSSSGNSPHLTNRNRNRVFSEPPAEENCTDISGTSANGGDDDTDDDIQILKFPRCAMCSAVNKNHFFPFCRSCYKIRKGFFPEKPKPRVRKKGQLKNSMPRSNGNYAPYELDGGESKQEKTTFGGELGQCKYFENETNADTRKSGENTWSEQTSNKLSMSVETASPNCTQDSGIGANNTPPTEPLIDERMVEKCLACFVGDTNALFLHGKTGHRCGCYPCAKKIWLQTRRCPICRSKVNNIIRILNP